MSDPFFASITVPGRIKAVRPAAAFVVSAARALGVRAAAGSLFENAVVEALNNAVEHNRRPGEESLRCEVEMAHGTFVVRVLDEAAAAPVPISPAAPAGAGPGRWEDLPDRGYGLQLIQAVFPGVRPVTRNGLHGVELILTL